MTLLHYQNSTNKNFKSKYMFRIRYFIHFPSSCFVFGPIDFHCFDTANMTITIVDKFLKYIVLNMLILNIEIKIFYAKQLYLAHDAKLARVFAVFDFDFLMSVIHFEYSGELWPRVVSTPGFRRFGKNFKRCNGSRSLK